jgi:hypothetical protein
VHDRPPAPIFRIVAPLRPMLKRQHGAAGGDAFWWHRARRDRKVPGSHKIKDARSAAAPTGRSAKRI